MPVSNPLMILMAAEFFLSTRCCIKVHNSKFTGQLVILTVQTVVNCTIHHNTRNKAQR